MGERMSIMTMVNLVCFILLILFMSGILELPSISLSSISSFSISSPLQHIHHHHDNEDEGFFTDLVGAFREWDSQVGCARFNQKNIITHNNNNNNNTNSSSSLQQGGYDDGELLCKMKKKHVSVLVKGWKKWLPDNLDNLYSCPCGLTCLWTKSPLLADMPHALFFQNSIPPLQRKKGEPIRVYMDMEAGRNRTGREDIFISYHAHDDLQATYAFHNHPNYDHISSTKNTAPLVYWSSSHCIPQRNHLAHKLLSMLPHHSFNNNKKPLSLYKFVLAIENTIAESYVTENLFYALDSGSVPIYFGAPNVEDLVPPNSVIDGTKFKTLEDLAGYVKALAKDPVAYAEYHAWRRCGVMGNYGRTRGLSLDTLPCRLCHLVSTMRNVSEDDGAN